jgi:hypothetical protein
MVPFLFWGGGGGPGVGKIDKICPLEFFWDLPIRNLLWPEPNRTHTFVEFFLGIF